MDLPSLDLLDTQGFLILENLLSPDAIAALIPVLQRIDDTQSVRIRGEAFAIRNLLDTPEIKELAESETIRSLILPILGANCFPVRGILFDKIRNANWTVPWHQDLTIAVQERLDAEGFGPWSRKAGVLHVQPPASILEGMLSARLHLDHCGVQNGPLRVIPASHRQGRIAENEIAVVRRHSAEKVCTVGMGGALFMRPLLLHASSPAAAPHHRRVIHLDYASAPLPAGLRWAP